jgi:hypothetical protein
MFACQWHLDIPFGKQKEVLDIMKRWDDEMIKAGDAPKFISTRRSAGLIGASPSHIVNEYVVNSLSDWEGMMKIVATGRYQKYSDEMARYIVPGSQHWQILRIAG